jgi:hypothetical protein
LIFGRKELLAFAWLILWDLDRLHGVLLDVPEFCLLW